MNQLDMLKKLATVMMHIETFLSEHAPRYLPKDRSQLIDFATISTVMFEDDYFTYDRLKLLTTNMVAHHEANRGKWFIDVDHCTSENVAITQEPSGKSLVIPISLFFATTMPNHPVH